MPPGCRYCDVPATTLCNRDTRLIVLQSTMLYYFDLSYCFLKWEIVRLIWIAFEKNDGKQCSLSQLPKDLIVYIISFLGNAKMDDKNKNDCFDLDFESNSKTKNKEKEDERTKAVEAAEAQAVAAVETEIKAMAIAEQDLIVRRYKFKIFSIPRILCCLMLMCTILCYFFGAVLSMGKVGA